VIFDRYEGLPDADRQENGQQELSSQEPRGRRNSRLNIDDLFWQDGHTDAEPDDGRAHVVRQ